MTSAPKSARSIAQIRARHELRDVQDAQAFKSARRLSGWDTLPG